MSPSIWALTQPHNVGACPFRVATASLQPSPGVSRRDLCADRGDHGSQQPIRTATYVAWTPHEDRNPMRATLKPSVVLVHGAFVDGSGWRAVYELLRRDGYPVAVVQNPTVSLQDDVAATLRIIAVQAGPVVLVGHSYGGAVITEAGTPPKVAALVYVSAFA